MRLWTRLKNWAAGHDEPRLEILPHAWGYALLLGGAEVFRRGITLRGVISFTGALLLGFMAWALFAAAEQFERGSANGRRLLYQMMFLVVITMIATGAPWR